MVTDGDYIYHGKHWVIYKIVEYIYCIPESNKTLYVNYTSITECKKRNYNEIPLHTHRLALTNQTITSIG